MPITDLRNWIDATGEIVEQTYNGYFGGGDDDVVEDAKGCYNALGGLHGYPDGYDFVDATIRGEDVPEPSFHGFERDSECDGIVDGAISNEITIPSLSNPWVAAGEIIFTPSVANEGEDEFIAVQRGAAGWYQDGYDAAYQEGSIDAFDANLEARFEPRQSLPEPAWMPPIDSPAAALGYEPDTPAHDSYSAWESGAESGAATDASGSSSPDSSVSSSE